jgi:hypothetical protein
MAVNCRESRPNDSSKIQESSLINLVSTEQFGVVAKIVNEPAELSKRTLCAVETPREGKRLEESGLENAEANSKEGLLRMRAIGSSFDPNEEDSVQIGR